MGHPIHRRDPNNLGEPCVFCEDSVWGEATTPKLVRIVFHKVIAEAGWPAPPNNKPFYCEQGIDPFCGWSALVSYGGYDWYISYDARVTEIYQS